VRKKKVRDEWRACGLGWRVWWLLATGGLWRCAGVHGKWLGGEGG